MATRDEPLGADDLRKGYFADQEGGLDYASDLTQSPVERSFFWAMCCEGGVAQPIGEVRAEYLPGGRSEAFLVGLMSVDAQHRYEFLPQVNVTANGKRYRLDFALVALEPGRRVCIDVEIDGHDFHERTKEQAEKDRKRDRDLQATGWFVARFTGSQVYRDPIGAAREAMGFALGLLSGVKEPSK